MGLQGATVQKRSLYSIMQQPMPQIDAETKAELAALEILFWKNNQVETLFTTSLLLLKYEYHTQFYCFRATVRRVRLRLHQLWW